MTPKILIQVKVFINSHLKQKKQKVSARYLKRKMVIMSFHNFKNYKIEYNNIYNNILL